MTSHNLKKKMIIFFYQRKDKDFIEQRKVTFCLKQKKFMCIHMKIS